MRRFTGRRPSATTNINRLGADKLRDLIQKVGRGFSLADSYAYTQNRQTRRMFARTQRHKGRGYTTPAKGRAHTRGSGRS